MNRSFKSIWSEAQGAWVAVSEVAGGRGKKSRSGAAVLSVLALGTALLAAPLLVGAQQTIGNPPGAPDPSALLDLRSSAAPGARGLLNARVPLTGFTDQASFNGGVVAKGLTVFNTATVGNMTPGLYTWNGSQWISNSEVPYVHTNSAVVGNSTLGNSGAIGGESIAVGANAKASGNQSIAIGRDTQAAGDYTTSMGYLAGAGAPAAITTSNTSIGSKAGQYTTVTPTNVTGYNVALGAESGNNVDGSYNVGIQQQAGTNVVGLQNVAIGRGAGRGVNGSNNVALGRSAGVGSTAVPFSNTVAIGNAAGVGADNAIAIGTSARAIGASSISIGTGNIVNGDRSGAIGDPTTITGTDSYSIGNNNTINANNAFVLGNNVTIAAGLDGAVGIGNNSTVAASKVASYNPGTGTVVGTAIGSNVVSVGAAGAERRITNVAAGGADTDAVNVSQLTALSQVVATGKIKFFSVNSVVGGNADNLGATGLDAIAIGRDATAAGDTTVALGSDATGSGKQAVAIGLRARASEQQSIAIGSDTHATDFYATAVGTGSEATNAFTTAVGAGNIVSGVFSSGIGNQNTVSGNSSTAVGAGNTINANNAFVLGNNVTIAAGLDGAVGIGNNSTVTASTVASYNPGTGNVSGTTIGSNVVSVGSVSGERRITNVAAGGADTDAVNVSQLKAVSAATSAIDFPIRSGNAGPYVTAATGKDSLAVGATAAATSGAGTAVGEASRAYSFSTALGYNANASGPNSMALGASSKAMGVQQTVLGTNAQADILSTESVVVGRGASAINSAFSTVVGTGASAIGNTNSVFGYQASALNVSNATAIGEGASVTGSAGIALGSGAAATANLTTAIGVGAASNGITGIALGVNAVNTVDNSVALGANAFDSAAFSKTTAGTTTYNSSVINGTTYNYAGGTPIGVVSVGSPGAERRIQNVAAGLINSTSTDAVNGSQLYAVADSLTYTVTAGATHYYSVNSTDRSAGSNYANDGATGANSLAAGVAALASAGQTTALGNGANAAVAGGVALGSASVADRALVPSTGILAAGRFVVPYNTNDRTLLGAVSVGNATSYRQITNVADGTQSQDAVTVRQLTGALQSFAVTPTKYFHANSAAADSLAVGSESVAVGPQTVVNGNNGIGIGNGATVQISAPGSIAIGMGANTQLADSIAMGTNASAAAVQGVALGAGSIVNTAGGVALGAGSVASTAAGARGYVPTGASVAQTAAVNATTSTLAGVSVGNAATGQLRQINGVAAGSVDSDAVNVSQLKAVQTSVTTLDNNAVKYDTTTAGTTNYNSVNLGNSNSTGPVTLGNVANGVAPYDAVNVQQLTAGVASANAYTDARVNGLQGNIDGVARKAYAGVASAMALESAPYIAGKTTYAAGVGYYQSQGAVGIALRRTADNGRWSVTGGVSASAGGVAVRAGVSGIWE